MFRPWALIARKLKCDGGRPACGQCFKRSNTCDYTPNHKRRGGKRRKSDDGSESELDGESGERSGEMEAASSLSPEMGVVVTQPARTRRNSNAVDMILEANHTLPPIDRRDRQKLTSVLPPISHPPSTVLMQQGQQGQGGVVPKSEDREGKQQHVYSGSSHELPPIATLPPVGAGVNEVHDLGQTLAPLRHQAEMQPPPPSASASAQSRRRTSSAASTKGRQNGYGSKIVACNFCRGKVFFFEKVFGWVGC